MIERRRLLLGLGCAAATLGMAAAAWVVEPSLDQFATLVVVCVGLTLLVASRLDPPVLASLYAVVLVLVPSTMVVRPAGAVGQPSTILGVLALWLWLHSRLSPEQLGGSRGRNPVRLALLVYASAMLASSVAGWWRGLQDVEASGSIRGTVVLASLCGMALLVADGLRRVEDLEMVTRVIAVCVAIAAAIAVIEFATGTNLASTLRVPGLSVRGDATADFTRSGFSRVNSTAAHPIELGVVLAYGFILSLHHALHDLKKGRRAVFALAAAVTATAIPLVVSRSAVLAGGVVVLVAAWSWSVRRKANLFVLLLGFLVLFRLAVPGLLGTLRSLIFGADEDPSVTGRTNDYPEIYRFFSERPVLGRGFATFVPEKYFFLDNQYLAVLVQSGVIGVTALTILLVTAGYCARTPARVAREPEMAAWGQTLAAVICASAVTLFTFDGFAFRMNAGLTFLAIGLAGAAWRLSRQSVASPAPARHQGPAVNPVGRRT